MPVRELLGDIGRKGVTVEGPHAESIVANHPVTRGFHQNVRNGYSTRKILDGLFSEVPIEIWLATRERFAIVLRTVELLRVVTGRHSYRISTSSRCQRIASRILSFNLGGFWSASKKARASRSESAMNS